MGIETGTMTQNLIFGLSETLQRNNIIFIFRGSFCQSVIVDILALCEKHFVKSGESPKVKKKIYNLMVEGLQNITRHQANYKDHSHERNGFFVLQKKKNGYFITTGNLIENSDIENLKSKLILVNSLNKEELKEHFRQQLVTGEISNKGGAGLGLLDMARKSGNKMAFDFQEIDQLYSYFYFRLEVNAEEDLSQEPDMSLNYVIELHEQANEIDIALVYNDVFDYEVQINLLTYLEKRLKETLFSKQKTFEIVAETIKTIVEHGETPSEKLEKPSSIFFINKSGDDFIINCGSYINNSKINLLKRRLNLLIYLKRRNLNSDYVEQFKQDYNNLDESLTYDKVLERLSVIKILDYSFHYVNETISFFSLKINIKHE
jgi:hypothetical protein